MVDTTRHLPRRTINGGYEIRPALRLPGEDPIAVPRGFAIGIGLTFAAGLIGSFAFVIARMAVRAWGL